MTASRLVALASAAALAFGPPAAAISLPGGGFSVSGKKGTFIKQVAGRKIQAVAAAAGGSALGLSSDAVNQGEFQAARLRMPQTEAKIAALLSKIEASWPYDKSQRLKVIVLAVNYYSAYSLPDGSIVVNFGLLDQAKSDDEIAFVLAHELGHLRLGHFAAGEAAAKRRRMIAQLGQFAAIASTARSGGMANFNTPGAAAARRASATGDLLNFISNVSEPSHSRGHEDEADAVGFDLSSNAAFAADSAANTVFDTIQADADNRAKLSEALEKQMKEELGKAAASGAVQSMMGGGGIGMGLLRAGGRIALGVAGQADGGPKHRPPEDRKKGIADYSAEAYPDGLPLRDEQTVWLKSLRTGKEYTDAKAAVTALAEAMKKRAAGDYPGAERQMALARATMYRNAPVLLNEAARIRGDMGDIDRADDLFTQAHLGPDQTYDGYVDHVRMLATAGRNQRALLVVDNATQRFGDDKPFLALMIAVARADGRDVAAKGYLARCLEAGDENLKKDCQAAAGDGDEGKKGGMFGLGKSGDKTKETAAK